MKVESLDTLFLTCGFCLETFDKRKGKCGVSGKDGFICIECIKLAKEVLDKNRNSPDNPPTTAA